MTKLDTPLYEIRGIGPKFFERLEKFGIKNIRDLLWHFPFRYEDFSKISKIKDLKINEHTTISGVITDIKVHRTWKRRMFIIEALITDDSGSVKAVWFNARFLLSILKKGKVINLAGKIIETDKGGICLTHPIYEFPSSDENKETKHTGRLVPIYRETKRLTSKAFRFLIKPLLDDLEKLDDPLPLEILKQNKFPEINAALRQIHFPATLRQAQGAKKRFAFEDLFYLQLANIRLRLELSQEKARAFPLDAEFIKSLLIKLPFELTQTQKQSLFEILKDFEACHPMNRLLQGDVGSGKTIVAAIAAMVAGRDGSQSAFMAPAEVLAHQHYGTFKKFFSDFTQGIGLLTSSTAKVFYGDNLESEIKKTDLVKKIASGEIKIIIGTHALIQKNIKFNDLSFVVIDEQHRFGVNQRRSLISGTYAEQTRKYAETEINNKLLYEELSYKIRSALFDVKKELGGGHKEIVYQKAVAEALQKISLKFSRETPIPIFYRDEKVGVYVPDFVVEDKIIIELKALSFVGTTEKKQIWRYLQGSNYHLAFLVNYGPRDLTIDRIVYDKTRVSASVQQSSASVPHFLSMSATPIPRTLTLTIFGDLDLSIISELPKGRKEIITKIVDPANRDKAYAFIRGQVKKGRQVFVICPRIEEPEPDDEKVLTPRQISLLEIKNVKTEYEKLSKNIFPDLKVGLLHGKLKPKEKYEIMEKFKNREIDILVSTSVIEVGVDVPNATIMMIESADRFGLAQLYQFRGRVGRGEHQSFCFLFTESSSQTTFFRLQSLLQAKNGFELAEKDLEIRGPGEFLSGSNNGWQQTGRPDLAMKAIQNPDLVKASREAAQTILQNDSELKNYPLLATKIQEFEKQIHLE